MDFLQNTKDIAWRLSGFILVAFFIRSVIVYGYRLWFHPLAHIPGPWLGKFSDWYGAWHSLRGQLHLRTWEGHEKYGPIVRQGPNKLIFNTVTAAQHINHSTLVQKSRGYQSMQPAPGVYNIQNAVDDDLHRFKRKVMSQGLSDSCMRSFEPSLMEHVNKFVQHLLDISSDNKWSSPTNMSPRCKYLGFDVMGQFGFGQSFEMQDKPENRFICDAVTAATTRSGVYGQFPDLAIFKPHLIFFRKISQVRKLYIDLTTKLINARIDAGKHAYNDLFSFIVDAKDPETGRGFTYNELWSETRFLLIAGADTSSTAITSSFFYLSRNPECYEKVAKEIRSAFSSPHEVEYKKTSQLTYLRACIDEAMRMSPPAAGTMWREVRAGGLVIDGQYVPAGSDVGCSIYSVHHNEDYFPDSYSFKPERWIVSEKNPKEKVDLARAAFFPFSLGPRACAGKTLAYMEISNTLAKTLLLMDFKVPEDENVSSIGAGKVGGAKGRERPNEFQLEDHMSSTHDGPYLQFRLRSI